MVGTGEQIKDTEAKQNFRDGLGPGWRQEVGRAFAGWAKPRCPFTALRARLLCLVDQTLVEDTGAGSKLCTCLGEKPTVRIAKISRGPSAAGLAAHVRLHEPYRTWCPSRVAGRGVSSQHRFESKDGCVVPGSVSTAAILRGTLVLTSGVLPWRCRTRVSKISGAHVVSGWMCACGAQR